MGRHGQGRSVWRSLWPSLVREPSDRPRRRWKFTGLTPCSIRRRFFPDWTEAERQALLRRALFDPATYGRVRFHHRSVQEYLAARRLLALHKRGMSRKGLFRLLFAKRYGVEVVLPSMRAIAAWLALRVDSVRKELIRREPETLVSYGDPGSLDLAARTDLLRAFVAEHGDGDWRGLRTAIDDARRLAHPDLAPVIRECWGNGPKNGEVRELLVKMIWQGPVEACGDLAHDVALDTKASPYLRIVAILALVACGWKESVRALADAMLAEPDSWPDRIVHGVAEHLYPEFIATDELIALMERTREQRHVVGGFGWVSRKIVKAIEPASDLGFELRDKLADLIWRGRAKESESLPNFRQVQLSGGSARNLVRQAVGGGSAPFRYRLDSRLRDRIAVRPRRNWWPRTGRQAASAFRHERNAAMRSLLGRAGIHGRSRYLPATIGNDSGSGARRPCRCSDRGRSALARDSPCRRATPGAACSCAVRLD